MDVGHRLAQMLQPFFSGETAAPGPGAHAHPPTAAGLLLGRRALLRWAASVVGFAVLYGGVLLLLHRTGVEQLASHAAERAGLWGVLLSGLLMVGAVMSPLPDAPVALAAFVAYGPLGGLAVVVLGSWLGAVADFLLVRSLWRSAFRRRFPGLRARLDAIAARFGLPLLVVLRLLPTVTFDLVSYTAALTRISTRRFMGATLVGLLPGPLTAACVGAGLGSTDRRLTAALGLLLLSVLTVLVMLHQRLRRPPPAGEPSDQTAG